MTSRGKTPSSTSKKPLESLVISLIPSLASQQKDRESISRATSRASLRSEASEQDERRRREKINDLVNYCEEILASRIPSSAPLDPSTLPEAARRIIYQSANKTTSRAPLRSGREDREGRQETGPERALKFGGIWSKLEKGRTLASPIPHLQFLMALSNLDSNHPPSAAFKLATSATVPANAAPISAETSPAGPSRGALGQEQAHTSADWKGKGKSKANVLKAWRTSQSRPPFPEHLLLRDTLYLLQGIDGRYVRFATRPPAEQNPYLTETGKAGDGTGFALGKEGGQAGDEGDEGDVVGIDIVAEEQTEGYISNPTRTLLVQISEMGMLYRKVMNHVDLKTAAGSRKGGMTEQSLCHFLHHELSDCHRLLAVLEAQMSQSVPNPEGQESADGDQAGETGLTLLRLGLWTEDMRLKMRLMAAVVDDAKTSHGGALVSKIHQQTRDGDPFVRTFMDRILEEVSKPFFATLQRWIFSGELHDPYQEFFVQLSPDAASREDRDSPYVTGDMGFEGGLDVPGGLDEAHRVWEKKYVFVKGMVPGFVSEEFGRKIFSTGRSLNFIRYSCRDSDWIETQAKLANAGRALKYSDLAGLERSIDDAYSIASQRLLEIFFDKFNLLDHLRALKAYLMLGAGDFAELLMEAMVLSKPAISLYRHHLTSDLETAIRGSNAQYDSPDILRRLDARILEYSHGELGWDCFTLEYKVEAPLNAVLDARAMIDYDKLFHHLWRVKRVETAISRGWMRVTSASRLFERIHNVSSDWHHCRIVQSEMVHFLRQIQAYCQLEVIECSWSAMEEYMARREGDLDALIKAHRTYLDRVVKKVLLLSSKADKEEVLLDQVRSAMDCILQFHDATDELYAWSLAEATRLDRERDVQRGLYSGGLQDDPVKSLESLRAIRERIRSCSINFQHRLTTICQLAAAHQDLDVRFLAIRIAFNGYYELRKPRKTTSKSTRA